MQLSRASLLTACFAAIAAASPAAAIAQQPPPPSDCIAGNCGLSSFGEPPTPPLPPESR